MNQTKIDAIVAEITHMHDRDQNMRQRALREPEYWDASVDKENTRRLKEIVRTLKCWPPVSLLGVTAIHAALIVRHADHDIEFQEECLKLMLEQPEYEVPRTEIAYLTDRIRVNRGLPQIYGTQFQGFGKGDFVPQKIEDEVHVDERRKRMALPTLAEGIAQMREKYRRFE